MTVLSYQSPIVGGNACGGTIMCISLSNQKGTTMTKIALLAAAVLGLTLAVSLSPTPAQATSAKTWVSSNGTNNATCGRTTPCDTFQHAHDATTAKGEINCIDAADYGPVSITKSISIVCDNTQAGINVTASNAVAIAAAATDVVTLRGLDLDGNGTGGNGIYSTTVGVVHVHNVRIRGFINGGINLGTSNYTELYVVDSHITECGSPDAFGGIFIQQLGSGSANVFVNRVRLENNSNGIRANGASTGVAVNVSVVDSVVSGSAFNGIQAITTAGHQAISIFVDHCVVSGNFASGINANGAAASGAGSAIVRIGDSSINNNVTGVSATNLGVLQSYKNNRISANLTDGTPIAAFPGPGGTPLQ